MRSRWRSGTSMGIVAIMAGLWNACPTLRAMTSSKISDGERLPARMTKPMANETRPTERSATMSTTLRLNRSATTPPKGDSSPVGR